jgi:hypothetical protein
MSEIQTRTNRTAAAVGFAVLLLCLLVGFAVHAGSADAKNATKLGATKKTPAPACPKSCAVAATETAFQTVADGKGSPFKVPSDGRIVAWSVNLGAPVDADLNFFNGLFPDNKYKGHPAARLSILKPKGQGKYKLTKQSPSITLDSRLGTDPIIALGKPLKVKKGQRVAITIPTWAPFFQQGLPSGDNQWIASREPGKCSNGEAKNAKPQQKIGSTRNYGCRFNGERLLYWAFFVPDGKKK